MIIAVDDVFVVPIPTMMKAVGFFQAVGNALIAPGSRDDVARRLATGTSGWGGDHWDAAVVTDAAADASRSWRWQPATGCRRCIISATSPKSAVWSVTEPTLRTVIAKPEFTLGRL